MNSVNRLPQLWLLPLIAAYESRSEGNKLCLLDAMEALEGGAIANPDEHRRVGHYWLRAPERAPSKELADAIRHANCRPRPTSSCSAEFWWWKIIW